MRHLLTALALTTSLTGTALAQTRFDGVWLFDDAGPNPGITMPTRIFIVFLPLCRSRLYYIMYTI